MMSLSDLRLHQEASKEVEEAYLWYLERDHKTARAFAREITLAITKIRQSPNRWPKYGDNALRYLLHRFPFQVIYHWDSAEALVYVLAVAHTRRLPGYWKARVEAVPRCR